MTEVSVHDFILGPVDTDSISFCKPDQSPFTEEEQQLLLDEINSLLPSCIQYDHDGYFRRVIICKAKNYVLDNGKKVVVKGSALKAKTKSPAMKEMIGKVIDSLLNDRNDFHDIYMSYIKEAANIKDITRWATRKTISATTLTSNRKNETIIKDVIRGTEYVEGDRIYTYYLNDDELSLVQNFDGNYSLDKMVLSVYDTIWVFENVIDCNQFKNYKLVRNKKELAELTNETSNRDEERLRYAQGEDVRSSRSR